jgi:hypothetical protein
MNIFVLENHALILVYSGQIFIENLNCQEVGALRTLEWSTHFDHPICHLGAILLRNLMTFNWIRNWCEILWGWVAYFEQIIDDLFLQLAGVHIIYCLLLMFTTINDFFAFLFKVFDLFWFLVIKFLILLFNDSDFDFRLNANWWLSLFFIYKFLSCCLGLTTTSSL